MKFVKVTQIGPCTGIVFLWTSVDGGWLWANGWNITKFLFIYLFIYTFFPGTHLQVRPVDGCSQKNYTITCLCRGQFASPWQISSKSVKRLFRRLLFSGVHWMTLCTHVSIHEPDMCRTDGRTDRHTTTAYTALAQRRAVKIICKISSFRRCSENKQTDGHDRSHYLSR